MSHWENVGSGLEAKITNKGQLMIREIGNYNDDYPHFIVSFDDQGNVTDYHSSEARHGSRWGENEIVGIALQFLRGKGML